MNITVKSIRTKSVNAPPKPAKVFETKSIKNVGSRYAVIKSSEMFISSNDT